MLIQLSHRYDSRLQINKSSASILSQGPSIKAVQEDHPDIDSEIHIPRRCLPQIYVPTKWGGRTFQLNFTFIWFSYASFVNDPLLKSLFQKTNFLSHLTSFPTPLIGKPFYDLFAFVIKNSANFAVPIPFLIFLCQSILSISVLYEFRVTSFAIKVHGVTKLSDK